jgi:hypothetical protein
LFRDPFRSFMYDTTDHCRTASASMRSAAFLLPRNAQIITSVSNSIRNLSLYGCVVQMRQHQPCPCDPSTFQRQGARSQIDASKDRDTPSVLQLGVRHYMSYSYLSGGLGRRLERSDTVWGYNGYDGTNSLSGESARRKASQGRHSIPSIRRRSVPR